MRLAGIDLAWQSEANPSAIAIGSINGDCLEVDALAPKVFGINTVLGLIEKETEIKGIAVDAPLIINNEIGQRTCEKEIGKKYGAKGASCHTSNKTLYPSAASVNLSKNLMLRGYTHLTNKKWQIECYPHPAIIEIFGLDTRLKYKKGKVEEKKEGQIQLAKYIKGLSTSSVLPMNINENICGILDLDYISSLKGQALKSNEDALDSIICLYIAALYSIQREGSVYGNVNEGYIWVPNENCI